MIKPSNNPKQELVLCQAQLASTLKELSAEKAKSAGFKESRANLTAIFDGFPDPLLILDEQTHVQMLNRAAASYCGIDYDSAIGKHYSDICPLEKQPFGELSIADMIKEGKAFSFERKNSSVPESVELVTLLPISDTKHTSRKTIFRIQDITEKEKMDKQLVLADRLASLSQLSSGVSHEIRNPLASIMLYVDIFADPKRYQRSEQELEILAEVKENVQKITNIITRVFDFARLNSSHKMASDINKLMHDILKLWAPKMKRIGVETELLLQPDLPFVMGDGVELQQVFSNLILNAIEAMGNGGDLRISTSIAQSKFHKQRKVVLITVQDSGQGISADLRQTIFNPFFSTKTDHSGLGLTISYQIIKRHGGVLSYAASKEKGCVFNIEIPMEKSDSIEDKIQL